MQTSQFRALSFRTGVLLERLGQIEALLHVVVVGGGGVDVPDAAVASLHFTMLLQSLKERERECVCSEGFPAALDSVCVFSNRQFLSSRYGSAGSYLNSFPAPLPVLGVVGQPPQVHVRLDDLGPEDEVLLVLPRGDGLHSAVESEGLGTQLQSWGRRRRR